MARKNDVTVLFEKKAKLSAVDMVIESIKNILIQKKVVPGDLLPSEQALFTVTLNEAKELLAQPRTRGRGQAAASPLAELGADPATGKPLVIKDGRFGPYVTDGEYNVTVPRSQPVGEVTLEQAADLLAAKRAKGPAPKQATRRSTTKTANAKPTSRKTGSK